MESVSEPFLLASTVAVFNSVKMRTAPDIANCLKPAFPNSLVQMVCADCGVCVVCVCVQVLSRPRCDLLVPLQL